MFGRRNKDGKRSDRWTRELEERGLVEVEPAAARLDAPLDMLAPEITRQWERRSLLNPSGPPLQYSGTRWAEVLRTAEGSELSGPGLIAAHEVRISTRNVGHDTIHYQRTTGPKGQVVVARLPRDTGTHLLVEPHYSTPTAAKFSAAAADAVGLDDVPRLDHPLLQYWWLVAVGPSDAAEAELDPAVAAMLWALRVKVSGAKASEPELAAQYEAMIPPTDRHYDGATVEVRGDLLALHRATPVRGLDDDIADQADHVARHFR